MAPNPGLWDSVKSAFDRAVSTAKTQASSIVDKAYQAATSTVSNVQAASSAAAATTSAAVDRAYQTATSVASTLAGTMAQAASAGPTAATTFLASAQAVSRSIASAYTAATDIIAKATTAPEEAAKDITDKAADADAASDDPDPDNPDVTTKDKAQAELDLVLNAIALENALTDAYVQIFTLEDQLAVAVTPEEKALLESQIATMEQRVADLTALGEAEFGRDFAVAAGDKALAETLQADADKQKKKVGDLLGADPIWLIAGAGALALLMKKRD